MAEIWTISLRREEQDKYICSLRTLVFSPSSFKLSTSWFQATNAIVWLILYNISAFRYTNIHAHKLLLIRLGSGEYLVQNQGQNKTFILRGEVEVRYRWVTLHRNKTDQQKCESWVLKMCVREMTLPRPQLPPLSAFRCMKRWEEKRKDNCTTKCYSDRTTCWCDPVWSRMQSSASDDRLGCWLTRLLHLACCAHANK